MLPYLEEIARNELGIDSDDFLKIVAVAQSFPGAMGINAAAIIGYRMGSWGGSAAAVLGVTIPGIICASLLFFLLHTIAGSPWLNAGIKALKAAVVGIILGMGVNLACRSWKGHGPLLVGFMAMLLFYWLQVSPILILLGSGLIGYVFLSPSGAE